VLEGESAPRGSASWWKVAGRALVLVLPCLAVAAPREAHAEVRWVAPEGCASPQRLVEAVARTLRRTEAEARTLDARAVVESASAGYLVRVDVAGGERTIEAKTCDELLDAAALVIALAVDPTATLRRDPPPAGPPARAPSGPSRASPSPPASPDPERRGGAVSPPAFGVGVAQSADVGTLPSAAIGANLFVSVGRGAFRAELGAGFFPAQTKLVSGDVGGALSLVTGAAKACALPNVGPLEIGGCAGVGFDRVAAVAVGAGVLPVDTSGTWPALDGEARAALPLTRWLAVRLSLGAHVALLRPSFAVAGAGEVHRPSAVSLRQTLGLELRFP